MPEISSRGIAMPASPIRRLAPFAEAAKKKGITVYHLNIGQPDIESPDVVLNALKNFDRNIIEYSHSAGFDSYREELLNYYRKGGINVEKKDVLVTTGGSEAIQFAFLACLNPGEEVLTTEPFYTNYNGFACMTGVHIRAVTAKIENGFALPPIADFEKMLTSKTKAILICNPNNPTGYLYSEKELHQLKDIVRKHDLYLFSDEVYREFCYDGKKHFSAMNLKGIEENVVLADSVSKRYSLCGARIGALVSRNRMVMDSMLKYAQARLSPPTLGQTAAQAALQTPVSYFKQVSEEYVKRRDLVVKSLNAMKGVYCPTPGGAFYVIARLPVDDADRFCQWLLEDFEYEKQTVMLAPASGFYATAGKGKNEVRIAYVLNTDELNKAMRCIEEALKTLHERS